MDTLDVQESIFIDFRIQLGRLLGDILETFLRFVYDLVLKWEAVSRSMVLMIQRWKCCWNPVAVCAITMVKTMVFE